MATTLTRKPAMRRLRPLRVPKKPMLLESLMTVEQWAALPEIKPPYELIDGHLVQKMVTTNEHDWTTRKISRFCDEWSDESGWRFFSQGAGTRIDPINGFIPDVMGFAPDVKIEAKATYNPPPFIVFEVLSKGTAKADRETKLRAYEAAGVRIYVIVDLKKRTLEIYSLREGKCGKPEILTGDAVWQPQELPGLKIELARLWF